MVYYVYPPNGAPPCAPMTPNVCTDPTAFTPRYKTSQMIPNPSPIPSFIFHQSMDE